MKSIKFYFLSLAFSFNIRGVLGLSSQAGPLAGSICVVVGTFHGILKTRFDPHVLKI